MYMRRFCVLLKAFHASKDVPLISVSKCTILPLPRSSRAFVNHTEIFKTDAGSNPFLSPCPVRILNSCHQPISLRGVPATLSSRWQKSILIGKKIKNHRHCSVSVGHHTNVLCCSTLSYPKNPNPTNTKKSIKDFPTPWISSRYGGIRGYPGIE